MPLDIIQVETEAQRDEIRALFEEYLSFLAPLYQHEFGVTVDVNRLVERSMAALPNYLPPQGRILLAHMHSQLAGCVGLRRISPALGEIKRLFVRPQYRHQGVGRALVETLIVNARTDGYTRLRLDSAPFLQEAIRLYQSLGFTLTPAYADSEIPSYLHARCLFMELPLSAPQSNG